MRHRIFVYGTLMSDMPLNGYIERGVFEGPASTEPGYRLFSGVLYPILCCDRRARYAVAGELWTVDDDILSALDRIERGYWRTRVRMRGPARMAWAYAMPLYMVDGLEEIVPPDWRLFINSRASGGHNAV